MQTHWHIYSWSFRRRQRRKLKEQRNVDWKWPKFMKGKTVSIQKTTDYQKNQRHTPRGCVIRATVDSVVTASAVNDTVIIPHSRKQGWLPFQPATGGRGDGTGLKSWCTCGNQASAAGLCSCPASPHLRGLSLLSCLLPSSQGLAMYPSNFLEDQTVPKLPISPFSSLQRAGAKGGLLCPGISSVLRGFRSSLTPQTYL